MYITSSIVPDMEGGSITVTHSLRELDQGGPWIRVEYRGKAVQHTTLHTTEDGLGQFLSSMEAACKDLRRQYDLGVG